MGTLSWLCQWVLGIPRRLEATQIDLASSVVGERVVLAGPLVHPLFLMRASEPVAACAGWSLEELDRYLRDSDEPLSPPDDALLVALESNVDGRALVLRELAVPPPELRTPAVTDAYARVTVVNERWTRMNELQTPAILLDGEARTMSGAVLELFEALRAACGQTDRGDAFAHAVYDLDAAAARGELIAGALPAPLRRAQAVLRALGFEQRLRTTCV